MSDWQDFERRVFGKASEPSGGSTQSAVRAGPQPSPFRQAMQWVKQALGLQQGNPPQLLDTAMIHAVMDVTQNGWPFAVYVATPNVGLSLIGPVGTFTSAGVITPDNKLVQRLVAYEMSHTGGAAPLTAVFRLGTVADRVGNSVSAAIAQVVMAPGATVTMFDIFGARDIWVPPGLQLTVDGGGAALAAGEAINFIGGVIQQIPAGFHL